MANDRFLIRERPFCATASNDGTLAEIGQFAAAHHFALLDGRSNDENPDRSLLEQSQS